MIDFVSVASVGDVDDAFATTAFSCFGFDFSGFFKVVDILLIYCVKFLGCVGMSVLWLFVMFILLLFVESSS